MSCETETRNVQFLGSQRAWRHLGQVFVALALVTLMISLTQNFIPSVALAASYSCGGPADGHCYGREDWPGNIDGAAYDVSIVHLSQGDEFIDDEMWVMDCDPYATFGCAIDSHPNWVEAGYLAGNGSEQYFWADMRPQDSNLNEHFLGTIPSGDYGNYTSFDIHEDGSNDFAISVVGAYDGFSGRSTNNSESPSNIELGQELAGSSGASAPRAYFIDNQWVDSGGAYHYQTSNGSIHGANPPWVGWNTLPQNSSTGGVLWTNCCG